MSAPKCSIWRVSLLIGLMGLLAVSSAARETLGQTAKPKYSVLPIPPELQEGTPENKSLLQIKSRVVGGSASFSDPANKKALDDWFNLYFYRSFTLPDHLHKLPLKRKEILDDLARAGSRQQTQDVYAYMRGRAEFWMRGLATTTRMSFHPAVRFNAVLVLGDLNTAEKSGMTRRFPTPNRDMLGTLVAELRKPNQVDAVKVAALIGILRHAKLQWAKGNTPFPANWRAGIATEMLKIVNQQQPQGRSASGHAWMQRRALDVLAALRLVGEADAVNQVVTRIVGDPDSDLGLRCTAARSLALLKTDGRAPLNPDTTSLSLGALAAQSIRDDLAWIDERKMKEEIKKIAAEAGSGTALGGGGAGGGDMGEMADMMGGMEMGAPDGGDDESTMMQAMSDMGGASSGKIPIDPEVQLARRRMKSKLVCIRDGLDAVAKAGQGSAQVKNIVDSVNAVMLATDPPEEDPSMEGFTKELRKKLRDLELLTNSAMPARAAPISDVPGAAPISAATGATSSGG